MNPHVCRKSFIMLFPAYSFGNQLIVAYWTLISLLLFSFFFSFGRLKPIDLSSFSLFTLFVLRFLYLYLVCLLKTKYYRQRTSNQGMSWVNFVKKGVWVDRLINSWLIEKKKQPRTERITREAKFSRNSVIW